MMVCCWRRSCSECRYNGSKSGKTTMLDCTGMRTSERVRRVHVIVRYEDPCRWVSAESSPPQFCQFEAPTFLASRMLRHTLPYRNRTTMGEKKRKRREENGERPKKKAATAPQGTVRVELIENKEDLGPILGMRPCS